MSHLGMITVVVDDYDSAIDYYTNALGLTLVEDTKMSETKRWVVVAPDANQGAALKTPEIPCWVNMQLLRSLRVHRFGVCGRRMNKSPPI